MIFEYCIDNQKKKKKRKKYIKFSALIGDYKEILPLQLILRNKWKIVSI